MGSSQRNGKGKDRSKSRSKSRNNNNRKDVNNDLVKDIMPKDKDRSIKEASESDASDDELTRANALKEFVGWSMEDHQNEMCALQGEFARLAKRHFDETCARIDDQVRSVNAGSDPEFKRNLLAVDRQYRKTCAALDAQKKLEFDSINNAYDEELYAVGETFEEDKIWYKQMLINQIRNKGISYSLDDHDGTDNEDGAEDWTDIQSTNSSVHQFDQSARTTPTPTVHPTKEKTKPDRNRKTDDSRSRSSSSPTRIFKTGRSGSISGVAPRGVASPASKNKFLSKVKQLGKTAPIIYMLQPHEIQNDIMRAFKPKKK